jgi:hypothetical protein
MLSGFRKVMTNVTFAVAATTLLSLMWHSQPTAAAPRFKTLKLLYVGVVPFSNFFF